MVRKNGWGLYALCVPAALLVVWMYGLSLYALPVLLVCLCGTVNRVCFYRRLDRQHELTWLEVTSYLEQLLCSYRRLGHAGRALEDCRLLFEKDSPMGQTLSEMVHILLTGEGVLDGDILEAAFQVAERRYNSRRMRIVHRFIADGEHTGAESGPSAAILLEDLEMWKNRTRIYQSKKRFIKLECGIATILALLLCYVSRLLTPRELGFDISDRLLYQITTILVFLVFCFILVTIYRKLSGEWLDGRELPDEKERKRYERLYDILCDRDNRGDWLSARMAGKILSRYVREEFPYWLLLVTLYLQSESCYQALCASVEETEGIFQRELRRLIEKIYDSPRSLEPYLEFFDFLHIPEVQSGMKILYSVNANGYENAKRQLDFLVAQNNRLMDKNETWRYSNRMAGMSLLKQLPMVVSCLKLLIDLVNLLAVTMGSFQNMQL